MFTRLLLTFKTYNNVLVIIRYYMIRVVLNICNSSWTFHLADKTYGFTVQSGIFFCKYHYSFYSNFDWQLSTVPNRQNIIFMGVSSEI